METLKEFSTFTKSRDEAAAVLNTLRHQPDMVLRNDSGRATPCLFNLTFTGEELTRGRLQVFNSLLNRMTEAGFISREIRGKRTFAIKVEHMPSDMPNGLEPPRAEPPPAKPPAEPEVKAEAEPETPPDDTEAEEDVQGRPGRTAARLERTLPDIVDRAVDHAFTQVFKKIAESFNIVTEIEVQDDTLTARISVLEEEIQKLRGELVFERAAGAEARRERNELREQMTKNAAPQSQLGPHDLDEPWRPLARQAISEGWRIEESSGGHLVWINPLGRKIFSAKTTANRRTIRHTRADMEAVGLKKVRTN